MTKIYYNTNDPFFQELSLLVRDAYKVGSDFEPFGESYKTSYPIDVYTTDEFLTFEIPLVGGNSDDVKITKKDNILTIKYIRPTNDLENNRVYVQRKIVRRDFEFQWKISSHFDQTKISSTYENGLLKIDIPRVPESVPEQIPIINIGENWKKIANGENL